MSEAISLYHFGESITDEDALTTAFFNQEGFNDAHINSEYELELYLNKSVPSLDTTRCPKCGSDDIKVTGAYLRGFDEAGVASAVCNNCAHKFAVR